MKALTVWQPWASLIIAGAKPYEFRTWDFASRFPRLVNARVAIHAASRRIDMYEVTDILGRIDDGTSSLDVSIAKPILERVIREVGRDRKALPLPCAAVLGTAVIGKPVRCTELFAGKIEADLIDPEKWAWPLTDIVRFDAPVDYRGAQGFWEFPEALAA